MKSTVDFYNTDSRFTLFPLNINKLVINNCETELKDYLSSHIFCASNQEKFSNQVKVYADKNNHHLRRTVKLDPIAEYFIYNFVYRNRRYFINKSKPKRKNYGFHLNENSSPRSIAKEHQEFMKSVQDSLSKYVYCIKCDISQYFNSIYHHDLIHWCEGLISQSESEQLGQFLREINVGRSLDCLPQGIFPTKVIGSYFLNFLENSRKLKCNQLLRFMDDIYIFGNTKEVLINDFRIIQHILGEKNLSINSAKTKILPSDELICIDNQNDIQTKLDELTGVVDCGSGFIDDELDEEIELDEEVIEHLENVLETKEISEEEVKLVLSFMYDNSESIFEFIPEILIRFPNLTRNLYYFTSKIDEKDDLTTLLKNHVRSSHHLSEYQLFWLAKICEDFLLGSYDAGNLLHALWEHSSSTVISKAKILEIADDKHNLDELREAELNSGSSSWTAWSAAIGSRKMIKSKRNQFLKYFRSYSIVNKMVAECVKKL